MNNENLIPYEKGDERAIQNGVKGALCSANSKKMKKLFKEMTRSILDHKIPEKEKINILSKYNDLDPEDVTYRTLIIIKQLEKALKGDLKSSIFLLETSGEKPKEMEEQIETRPPIFNIQVVDNSHLEKEFEKYDTN